MLAQQPLAEPADLALRLGLPSTDDDGLILAVKRASERFRAAVGKPVSLVTAETVVLDGTGTDTLLLPSSPVLSVQAVAVAGSPVSDWSVNRRVGVLRRRAGWPDDLGNVTVTYTHGHVQVPGDVQDAVLEQAEAVYRAAAGVQAMTTGGRSITFSAAGTTGTTQRWAEAVARHRQVGL